MMKLEDLDEASKLGGLGHVLFGLVGPRVFWGVFCCWYK